MKNVRGPDLILRIKAKNIMWEDYIPINIRSYFIIIFDFKRVKKKVIKFIFLLPSKIFDLCDFGVFTVRSVSRTASKDLPVIVGGHGSDWLRDGLVHVVETGRLDGRQSVVVAATTTPAAATTDHI